MTILLSSFFLFFVLINFCQAKDLYVPWTSQAPDGNWAQPWQDACEETSIVMLDYYYAGDRNLNKEIARQAILKKFELKNKTLGYSHDEDASKIIYMIDNFSNWQGRAVNDPDINEIKNEINNGRPVIFLAYAPFLQNSNFHYPQADYHVLVIKGYDDEKRTFITNDPGTQFGLNYNYSYEIIISAMHDYLPDNRTRYGSRTVIFTAPANKYFANNTLIKRTDSPAVYLLKNNQLRYIVNEHIFLLNGWHWQDIKLVSPGLFTEFEKGADINTSIQ